jgi:DNA repair exonuclease SbcCD ATPase subunit
MEPGQQSEFQIELRKVIFSHISEADRLGKETLDELIRYKTEELKGQIENARREVSRVNAELVRLEEKASPQHIAQLEARLRLRQQELKAHTGNQPEKVEQPSNISLEQQAATEVVATSLANERATLENLDTKITQQQALQKTLTEKIAIARKIEGKVENFEAEHARLERDIAADLEKLDLEFGAIVALKVDKGILVQSRQQLVDEKAAVDADLAPETDTGVVALRAACLARIAALQDRLDAPNKQYQRYIEALRIWQEGAQAIEGDATEFDVRNPQKPITGIASQLRRNVDVKALYDFLWSFGYLEPEYSLKLDGKDLSHLSPGERGTLLLVFYLLVDKSNKPIIVDQPEENLDSQTVFRLLIPVIKDVKKRRQIIMVTHSPNIAVVCDAEQIIHAHIDRSAGNSVIYTMGGIESPDINRFLVDVLEGTRPAFDNRGAKYFAE